MIYNKLVRDKIPEIIAKEGKTVKFRAVKGEELDEAIRKKILEEAAELASAKTDSDIVEEAADLIEIVEAFLDRHVLIMPTVENRMGSKYREKGRFEYGFFLESVDEPESDPIKPDIVSSMVKCELELEQHKQLR